MEKQVKIDKDMWEILDNWLKNKPTPDGAPTDNDQVYTAGVVARRLADKYLLRMQDMMALVDEEARKSSDNNIKIVLGKTLSEMRKVSTRNDD